MRRLAAVTTLLAVLGAGPGASASEARIDDQGGDANGVNGAWYSAAMLGYLAEVARDVAFQGDPAGEGIATGPASLAAADLREVSFATEYEGVPTRGNGVDYRATGLVVRFRTEAPPRAPEGAGSMSFDLVTQARPPGPPPNWEDGDPLTFGYTECRMALHVSVDEDGAVTSIRWYRFENCGAGNDALTHPSWTASVTGSTITARFPLSSFDATTRASFTEGGTLVRPRGTTVVRLNTVDVTREGTGFTIGSDMPSDVACTEGCGR